MFAPDGEAFVGYAVVGTTAVALGEPIGREGSTQAAANAFVEFCALNGWTPVFHQVTLTGWSVLTGIGCKALKIGEEAIVELAPFGRFDSEYLRSTPVVAVIDDAGDIQAFANVLPTYRSLDASFDLMRRRPDAITG